MEQFIKTMERAIKEGKGIRVMITMPNLPQPEMIINPPANIKSKLEYYRNAYDESLRLKNNPIIRIEHYETFKITE